MAELERMAWIVRRRDGAGEPEPRLDYHDPTAGFGGSPPAASALTLRIWLASAACVGCVVGVVLTVLVDGPVTLIVVLAVVALSAMVDLAVLAMRKRRP